MKSITIALIILPVLALQVVFSEITKNERSIDSDEDGVIDAWSTSYFRNGTKILEKTKLNDMRRSDSAFTHINCVYYKEQSVLITTRRKTNRASTSFTGIEGIVYLQFENEDDSGMKRVAIYEDNLTGYMELFAVDAHGGLTPVEGEEYSTFASEMGFVKEFTGAALTDQDAEKAIKIVEKHLKTKSNQSR